MRELLPVFVSYAVEWSLHHCRNSPIVQIHRNNFSLIWIFLRVATRNLQKYGTALCINSQNFTHEPISISQLTLKITSLQIVKKSMRPTSSLRQPNKLAGFRKWQQGRRLHEIQIQVDKCIRLFPEQGFTFSRQRIETNNLN